MSKRRYEATGAPRVTPRRGPRERRADWTLASRPRVDTRRSGLSSPAPVAEGRKRKRPFDILKGRFDLIPAATYSPTRSPVQYHRRWRA